jgi:hypothetical protein
MQLPAPHVHRRTDAIAHDTNADTGDASTNAIAHSSADPGADPDASDNTDNGNQHDDCPGRQRHQPQLA